MGYGSEDFDLAQTKLRALGALLLAADENTVDDVHEGVDAGGLAFEHA